MTLLWDGLAVHRAPEVRAVLARCKRVEVHRLPAYAPELHAVEPMWANGKGATLRGLVPEGRDDLEIEARLALDDIARDQRLLRSFFQATPLTLPGIAM